MTSEDQALHALQAKLTDLDDKIAHARNSSERANLEREYIRIGSAIRRHLQAKQRKAAVMNSLTVILIVIAAFWFVFIIFALGDFVIQMLMLAGLWLMRRCEKKAGVEHDSY
jgi:uncharacterized membrane protein